MTNRGWRAPTAFVLLAFGLTWVAWIPMVLQSNGPGTYTCWAALDRRPQR